MLPPAVVGTLIIVIAILSALKQINIGTLKQLDTTFAQLKADKLGLKIFIPSLAIAFVAMAIAQFTKLSGTVAIGIAAVVALLLTFAFTKAKPIEYIEDTNRMFQSVGVFAILPQLLASLGALFTAAGVGDVISNIISGCGSCSCRRPVSGGRVSSGKFLQNFYYDRIFHSSFIANTVDFHIQNTVFLQIFHRNYKLFPFSGYVDNTGCCSDVS